MKDSMYRNSEGYHDPTPGTAWEHMRKSDRKQSAERLNMISDLMPIIKQTAGLAGFEIVGRITFRDKTTGKEYR